jgi:hypothetical protein
MIPPNLHWAFETGHRVNTLAGAGKMVRHRLANLILPTGKVAVGYPGDGFSNQPNSNQPQVLPGSYPVFINVVKNKGGSGAFAFVSIHFTDTKPLTWEAAGKFFTDRGDGCIFDASATDLLRKKRDQMSQEEWGWLKMAALQGGDGNLILDAESGANAIVFRSGDWSYDCFLGRDDRGEISSFVVDGRVQQSHENILLRFLSLFIQKR